MQKIILILCCLLSVNHFSVKAQKLTDWVDPMIGSGGHGHVFVGANVPYGAVQAGPSNFFKGWDWCSGYHYGDSVIVGFSQLHLSGTGIGDLGDILIMPYMGDVKLKKGIETKRFSGYSSLFSHKNEKVRPGYYAVKLDDYNIDVELTASERVGFHKYKFPQGKNARIIIDLAEGINDKSTETCIEQVDKYTIKGYRSSEGWAKKQQVFFAVQSSIPVVNFTVYDDSIQLAGKKGEEKAVKGLISFNDAPGEILLKVGISPVSADNALSNIKAEIPDWNFEKIKQAADEKWEKELAKISIETKNEIDKRIFYTAMYHLMMDPSLFNDSNGDYRGSDWEVYKKAPFDNYTIFSLWDTYRAAHPLFTIIDTKRTSDFVNSMLAIFDQTGKLPVWHLRGYETGTMVGISSFQVIAEAYLKGCKGFDAEKAYQALKTTAMSDIRGLDYVRDMKAIPSDVMKNRPVSMALELAIGDASIALMAKKMGKSEDYAYFKQRAENYKLYYDRETGFFRGKMANGDWNPVFDPLKSVRPWATDYAEGNAWQYLWLVPQDVEGLIRLLGGEEIFIDRLNTFFSLSSDKSDPDVLIDLTGCIGQYAHGNEPSHHIAYLYAFAGQQWKTAGLTRRIMKDFYSDQLDGIIGNEDCGQMSAWYIFSSLGFYPVFTASGQYVIGSPLFDKATIHLENGKTFTVETTGNSPNNIYVQSLELNGKEYKYSYITQQDIMSGGVLKITLGSKPDYEFGSNPACRPQTGFSNEYLSKAFVHPGMAQSGEDLEYMKEMITKGVEPWKTAFENLKKETNPDFKTQAVSYVSVGPYGANSIGGREFSESATAACNLALMWYITKDKVYAGKAIDILNAWSYKLKSFDGNNAKLNVGLSGYYYLNAAEILNCTDSGWEEKDREQFRRMALTVFYPTIEDFFTEANGNWDASIISIMFCIAVFTDNQDIFNRALERFYRGPGNSGITKYIYPGGQCQEATRDWGHVQLGIGEFAKAAQTAYNQGIDLYSVAEDRLAQGFEKTAKMMLEKNIDIYGVLSKRDTEKYRDIYEAIYDYYRNVRGIDLPYTGEVIAKHTRPGSSAGFLSSVKRQGKNFAQLKPLIIPEYLLPTQTGALDKPAVKIAANAVVVRPEESIQETIDKNRGNGKQIVLSEGVFTLREPLKLYSGTSLSGMGKGTKLFLSPEVRTETIINGERNMQNVVIRDLLIEGAVSVNESEDPNNNRRIRSYMSAPSREGIVFRSDMGDTVKNILFENVTVQNFTKNGVLIDGGQNIKIIRCDFSDNGSSVVPGAGFHHNLKLSYIADCEILNSRFDTSPWGNGISILFGKNIILSGNETARNKLSGIYCAESENITITGNRAEGNDKDGISIDKLMDGCKSITLRDNLSQWNGED